MLLLRTDQESLEARSLAPYATLSQNAHRLHPDTPDDHRTAFVRDRARILHSKAWRRMRGKTQVFLATDSDHYRNRMTHSLEVAQLSREMARLLAVNEDLAETIALAHDLGHTPFGHVGEKKLDTLLRPYGLSFEHNLHSYRIVTQIERKYPDVLGLNLTIDTLTGLLKHESPYDRPTGIPSGSPSIEAQIANLADEIAYTSADTDDGLRSGLITLSDIRAIPLLAVAEECIPPALTGEWRHHRIASALIAFLIKDALAETTSRITNAHITTRQSVEQHPTPLVAFSRDMKKSLLAVQKFLFDSVYLSPLVSEKAHQGAETIERLFHHILKNPSLLPSEFSARLTADPLPLVTADFIAGMTDDFATRYLAE